MNLSLEGKTAFVAGASQGIGRAIAKQLAGLGAEIIAVARNKEKLKDLVDNELDKSHSQKHRYIVLDFQDIEKFKEEIKKFSTDNSVNILINNTGGPAPGTAIDADEENFIAAFKQHLICNQILSKSFIPGMKSSDYGRIINIISVSVKEPIENLGVSNTIRGAVASWAKTIARELGPFGITVNNVLPGYTATERLSSLIKNISKSKNMTVDQVENQLFATIPLRRFADPQETANAVSFLASPAAAYITGTNIVVDGGRLGCL